MLTLSPLNLIRRIFYNRRQNELRHFAVNWAFFRFTDCKTRKYSFSSPVPSMQCGADVRATYRKQRILTYNNDLPINCSKKLSFRIFADDTNMFYTSDKLQHLETVMNEELKLVFKYILIKIYTGDHRFNTTHGQQACEKCRHN